MTDTDAYGGSLSCHQLERAIQAYVDGELDASHVMTTEQHLASCGRCEQQVALLRVMKRSIRSESRAEGAPASLRARILASAAAESQPAAVIALPGERPRHAPAWRTAVPWAAAAAVAIGVGGGVRALGWAGDERGPARTGVVAAIAAHTPILDDFAELHARPLPPEEIDPVRISNVFSPIVGVPVRPIRFTNPARGDAYQFAGARLMSMHDASAATLFYDVGGTRVTVFVYDPVRVNVQSACCLTQRVVRVRNEDRTVLLGRARGYPLALQERDGIGYAVSADLGEQEVMRLAASLPSPER